MKKKPNIRWIESKKIFEYRFTYQDKRYSVFGKTQKELNDKADEKKELIRSQMNLEKRKITLERYHDDVWEPEQEKAVKPSTLYHNKKLWTHIKKSLGKKKLIDITKVDVIRMQRILKKDGRSTYTNNRAVKLLKQILKSAESDRIIDFNPAGNVTLLKADTPKAVETNHRALSKEEVALFLKQAERSSYYNLFRFLLNSGCRIGEALALQWTDIDFVHKEIKISRTASRVSNTEYVVFDSCKTSSSERSIPLTDALEMILKQQKKQNNLLFGLFGKIVFPNTRGEVATHNSVNECVRSIINTINKKHSLEHFSVHAFRDTYATECIRQGVQPNTLKTVMGHSSLKMTMDLYCQIPMQDKADELAKVIIAV